MFHPPNRSSLISKLIEINTVKYIFYLAVFILGYVLFIIPILGQRFEYIPGGLGDARLNIYFLEHAYRWAFGNVQNFWDAPFYFPVKNVMSYSDTHLGSFAFYSIFRLLGYGRETSYQLWIVFGIFLNYLSMIWLLNKYKFNIFSICVGATVFAFSSVAIVHLMHSQLLYRFPLPFALFYFAKYLNFGRVKDLAIFYVFLAVEFYCSIYLGYFAFLFFLIYLIANQLIKYLKISNDYSLNAKVFKNKYFYLCFIVFILSILPLFYPYLITALVDKFGNSSDIVYSMLPRFESYLLNNSPNKIFGVSYADLALPVKHEHIMYLGILPILSILYFIFHNNKIEKNKPVVLCSLIALCALVFLTLNIRGSSLYSILLLLPGVDSIRAVSRVILVLLLPASILSAYFIEYLLINNRYYKLNYLVIFLLTLLYLFENKQSPYHFSKDQSIKRLNAIVSALPPTLPPDTVLAHLNRNVGLDDYYLTELDSMLVAQSLGIPTINGYSGRSPKGHLWLVNSSDVDFLIKNYIKSNATISNAMNFRYFLIYGGESGLVGRWHESDKELQQNIPLKFENKGDGSEYKSSISAVEIPSHIERSKKFYITLDIKNVGSKVWLSSGENPVRLSYRWRESSVKLVGAADFNARIDFTHDIHPGRDYRVRLLIESPKLPGNYYLEYELVKEHVSFFDGYHDDAIVSSSIKVN